MQSAGSIFHVQLLHRHVVGKSPIKRVKEGAGEDVHHGDGESGAGAASSAGSEGEKLEVVALHVGVHVRGALQESLRSKLQGIVPDGWVAGDGPGAHQHRCACRDVISKDFGLGFVHVGEENGRREVEAERFFHHRLQVVEVGNVAVLQPPGLPHHGVKFASHFAHYLWVSDALG